IVALFIRPLRIKDTQLWIDGVPVLVARLFDWLEDIVNLHAQLAATLRATLDAQYPVVLHITGALRMFVPRLEMYQPYVVRVEEVLRAVRDMARDQGSDFGEFMRIQEGSKECEGWSLDRLLAEPINRVVEYPNYFRVRCGSFLPVYVTNPWNSDS
ncbi:Dbl homology domain-containing protein, partial [Vararia minispora EC-137]